MTTRSANVYARIEPEVKAQAEQIMSVLGLSASNAITLFYKQIILHGGLPFAVTLPGGGAPDMSRLSQAEIDAELEKGLADVALGHTRPAREVFTELRHNLKA